jgi:hypothetical protein
MITTNCSCRISRRAGSDQATALTLQLISELHGRLVCDVTAGSGEDRHNRIVILIDLHGVCRATLPCIMPASARK